MRFLFGVNCVILRKYLEFAQLEFHASFMIEREIRGEVLQAAKEYPMVTIIGPRQSGKTTLAQELFAQKPYFSLEDPDVRRYAQEDPRAFLADSPDGAILDEFQNVPELLSYLQGVVDRDARNGLFILTGSQNFLLMESVSQSLAGRTAILTLLPLSIEELCSKGEAPAVNSLLHKGLLPRIHDEVLEPLRFHRNYFQTYVERDLRSLLNVHNLQAFETFVRLCAGRVGQILNLSSLASDAGISQTTAKEWLHLLETSFISFRLYPWYENIGKRLVKSPKIYFHDVGLAAYLCGIEEEQHLFKHPLRGNFFENLVISEFVKQRHNQGKDNRLHFYRDSHGNEIDLLYPIGRSYVPVEIKSGTTVATDWFKQFTQFKKVKEDSLPGMLVYGGEEVQKRSLGTVTSIWKLRDCLSSVMSESVSIQ